MRTQPEYSNAGFVQPITIRQGSDFTIVLALFNGTPDNPVDITNVEAKASMRNLTDDTVVDFTATIVMVDGSAQVQFRLPREMTSALQESPVSLMAKPIYAWTADVKLNDGNVVPLCYGPGKVIKGETTWP